MKKYIYSIIIFLFSASAVMAQSAAMSGDGPGGPKKPIIDDVGALTIDVYDLDKISVEVPYQALNGGNGISDDGSVKSDVRKQEVDARTEQARKVESVRKNLKFYPNPVVNYLNVDLGENVYAKIGLVNILGQEVYNEAGEYRTMQINVQNFAPGSYFLTVKIGSEQIVKRIEISK